MTAAATAGGLDMTSKAHRIEIGALCSVAILISLWGIVWDITSGLITSGIDGIMLLLIALMIAGIFSLMFAHMLWQAGLIPFLKPAPAAAAPAPKPAAAKPASAAPAAPAAATGAPPKPPAAPSVAPASVPAAQSAPAAAPKPAPAASPSTTTGEPPTK
jgi:pyruvate/2-oxoglutarate dehydrogenase complex dihydrolipoamide acyltransferase (E2) component